MDSDPIVRFLRIKSVRRVAALAVFVGLLVLFRHLIPLLVFFLAFSRGLGAASSFLAARTGVPRKAALLGVVATLVGALASAAAFGVGRGIRAVITLRQTLPEKIALIRQSALYERLQEYLQDTESYLEGAKHYATSAAGYVTSFGRLLLYATIGLILAVVYLLEQEELSHWTRSIDPRSLGGALVRWFGYLADAVVVTIQLQIIVAVLNALFTLPILIGLGIPHAGPLALLIFASSLVPVVGNLVSGAVLILLAYNSRGWVGVGVFVTLTFVLHKVESYYLNPRLTARHIRLPGMVLIASLIAWEHLLGIVGLFVSFPFLFVANKIRQEMKDEDTDDAKAVQEALETTV